MKWSGRRPHILFVARNFTPAVGGKERYCARWLEAMQRLCRVTPVVYGGPSSKLWYQGPWLIARAIVSSLRRVDLVHLGDASLAALGWVLRATAHAPVTATIYGLDITWTKWGYDRWNPTLLRRLDQSICISRHTEMLCRQSGVSRTNVVIPGVDVPARFVPRVATSGPGSILFVGRWVERKGITWFLREVWPAVAGSGAVCRVVGYGKLESEIRLLAATCPPASVQVIGQVSDDRLAELYDTSDVFVMPNVSCPNDVEGFGLSAVEAAARSCLVLASRVDAIPEAIQHGRNGLLLPPGDAAAWVTALRKALANPVERAAFGNAAAAYCREHLGWGRVAEAYMEVFDRVLAARTEMPRPRRSGRNIPSYHVNGPKKLVLAGRRL